MGMEGAVTHPLCSLFLPPQSSHPLNAHLCGGIEKKASVWTFLSLLHGRFLHHRGGGNYTLISIPAASDSKNQVDKAVDLVSCRFTSIFTACLVPPVESTGGVKLRPLWAVPGSTGPSLSYCLRDTGPTGCVTVVGLFFAGL